MTISGPGAEASEFLIDRKQHTDAGETLFSKTQCGDYLVDKPNAIYSNGCPWTLLLQCRLNSLPFFFEDAAGGSQHPSSDSVPRLGDGAFVDFVEAF